MRSPLLDRLGICAVLFDLDGVLIDSMPFHYEAYRRVLAEEGLAVDRMDIYLREGLGTPDVLRALSEERGWALSPERIQEIAGRRRRMFYQIYQHRVFAEIPEMLSWLSAASYRLGVVSGATEQSLNVCLNDYPVAPGRGALGQWFPLVISGSSVKRGKPFPDPYWKAVEELRLEGRQVVVVENAWAGIAAAQAAGCYCVALETTLPAAYLKEAHWVLPDHAALLRLLRDAEKENEKPPRHKGKPVGN